MKKLNFKGAILREIKQAVDEDQLLPAPELGEPYYVRDDEEDLDQISPRSASDYDTLLGFPSQDVDDYVDYINEQCVCTPSKGSDYSLDSMKNMASPGEALGIGVAIGKHKRSGAYMSKAQLYKVAKYAERLYEMIPDNYDLEDWMRSKLSEISDDIGEVYHALDHRKFKGKI